MHLGKETLISVAMGAAAGGAVALASRNGVDGGWLGAGVGMVGLLVRLAIVALVLGPVVRRFGRFERLRWTALVAALGAEYTAWVIRLDTYRGNAPTRFAAFPVLDAMGGATGFGPAQRAFLEGGFSPLAVWGFVSDCAANGLRLSSPLSTTELVGGEVWLFVFVRALAVGLVWIWWLRRLEPTLHSPR